MKTMKYVLAIALGMVTLVAPSAVRADSATDAMTLLFAYGTFQGGYDLDGTLVVDTTNDNIYSADLTITGAADLGPFNLAAGIAQGELGGDVY